MAAQTVTPQDEKLAQRSLWLGVSIWFLHLNLVYALTSVGCTWGWFPFKVGGLSGLQFTELLIGLAAAAFMAWLIFLPWREWRGFQARQPRRNPGLMRDTESGRRPLMAFLIMGLNAFFLLFILATLLPVVALSACAQA